MAFEDCFTFFCLQDIFSEWAESLSLKLDKESSTSSKDDPNDECTSFKGTSVVSYKLSPINSYTVLIYNFILRLFYINVGMHCVFYLY